MSYKVLLTNIISLYCFDARRTCIHNLLFVEFFYFQCHVMLTPKNILLKIFNNITSGQHKWLTVQHHNIWTWLRRRRIFCFLNGTRTMNLLQWIKYPCLLVRCIRKLWFLIANMYPVPRKDCYKKGDRVLVKILCNNPNNLSLLCIFWCI